MTDTTNTRYTEALGRDVYLRPNTSDEQTWTDTFQHLYHVPPANISPRTVLDLGSNIGLTAAHYQTIWPEARIVAVEMDKENALVCQENFFGPLIIAAIGVCNGRGSYTKGGWQASYSLHQPGETEVIVIGLNEILDSLGHGDFIKMDVEGVEWDLLAAPEGWASRTSSLLVELHGAEPAADMLQRGISLLEAAGFTAEPHLVHPHALWAVR